MLRKNGRRITIESGSPNAAWGRAIPSGLLSRPVCRRVMKRGRMATATGKEQAEREQGEYQLPPPELVAGDDEGSKRSGGENQGSGDQGDQDAVPHPTVEAGVGQRRLVVGPDPGIGEPDRVGGQLGVAPEPTDYREAQGDDDHQQHDDRDQVEKPSAEIESLGGALGTERWSWSRRSGLPPGRGAARIADRGGPRSGRARRRSRRPRWR